MFISGVLLLTSGLDMSNYLPILKWIKLYNFNKFRMDLIAGISVSLMVIPQSLVYASLADLPLEYGLYASFPAALIYTFFGSSDVISVGPTAIMSLIVAHSVHGNITNSILLSFISGIFQIILGLLQIGSLSSLISKPILSAFVAAASLTIALSQMKYIVGYHIRKSFIYALYDLFANIKQIELLNSLIALIALFLLIFIKKYASNRSYLLNKDQKQQQEGYKILNHQEEEDVPQEEKNKLLLPLLMYIFVYIV